MLKAQKTITPLNHDAKVESAELIVKYLEQIGVEYVFGVPGGTVEPLYSALAVSERQGGPRAVMACHETGAAYMADGYTRETGKLGVCTGIAGPGATNLITGVACAYDNKIPMLVITGQPKLTSFGRGASQESSCTGVNVLGMFDHCTRYNSLVSNAAQLETKLVNAITKAFHSPPGPAHLSIPVDILREPISINTPSFNLAEKLAYQGQIFDEAATNKLFSELKNSTKTVFFIGSGAANSIDLIMKLINLTSGLFITAPDAKGLINPFHKSYRGVFGFGGHTSAEDCLNADNDLIVAFGTGFDELSSASWDKNLLNDKLIHVDNLEDNLMRSPMAKFHVQGHLRTIATHLITRFAKESIALPKIEKHTIGNLSVNPALTFDHIEHYYSEDTPIKPQRLMRELSERFPPNTRFLADTGNSMIWAPHFLQVRDRRNPFAYDKQTGAPKEKRSQNANWLRMNVNFSPMGWAIGASIGVARGNPDNPVVCITGDGAYLMCGQEITMAAQEKLPVIFVILNDSAYGMVMHGQRLVNAEQTAFELRQVDFSMQAQSIGINSYIINSPEDFDQIDMNALIKQKAPTILDVRIDREAIPPMSLRLKALGTFKHKD